MWIRIDDKGWLHDLIWGDILIGTDENYALLKKLKVLCGWRVCDIKISRPIWSTMWIRTDDKKRFHVLIWGAL
jgi:hypothetical protein